MSYRPLYLEVKGHLVTEAPLHVGGEPPWHSLTDAPILQRGNKPLIPGPSLKGILRAWLTGERALLGCTEQALHSLFGFHAEKEGGAASLGRLRVFDALLVKEQAQTDIRDHAALNSATGTAAHQNKFDGEVAPALTRFDFRAIYEGDTLTDDELILLRNGLEALQHGWLRAGAKSGWGYGKLKLEEGLRTWKFQRNQAKELAGFLSFRLENPPEDGNFEWRELPGPKPAERKLWCCERGPKSWYEFTIRLQFEGPMLVKSGLPPVVEKADTFVGDHIYVSENQRVYLPGSSLRGVLRARARQICSVLSLGTAPVDRLFGTAKTDEDHGPEHHRLTPMPPQGKGLIEIGDGDGGQAPDPEKCPDLFMDHVAIDRITGFAADKRKFALQALDSPHFVSTVRVLLEPGDATPLTLWMLLLRDLREGRLWCGSGTTRGYGKLAGARVTRIQASVVVHAGLPEPDGPEASGRVNFDSGEGERDVASPAWLLDALEADWSKLMKRVSA